MEGNEPSEKRSEKRKWPIVAAVVAITAVAAGGAFGCGTSSPASVTRSARSDGRVRGGLLSRRNAAGERARASERDLSGMPRGEDRSTGGRRRGLGIRRFRNGRGGPHHADGVTADKGMCAQSGCHDWESVVAATQDWGAGRA